MKINYFKVMGEGGRTGDCFPFEATIVDRERAWAAATALANTRGKRARIVSFRRTYETPYIVGGVPEAAS